MTTTFTIWGVTNNMITNVADALAPFFSGDKQLDEAVAKVVLFVLTIIMGAVFIYGVCSTNGQKPHCDDDCDNCPFPRCDDASRKDVDG